MKKKGTILGEELNVKQLIHALRAMIYLDIITDADVKYHVASDGSRVTQKFYNDVTKTESTFHNMEKLIDAKGYMFIIREVSVATMLAISLLAEGMIGVDDAEKHLAVMPTHGKFADLKIRP